MRVDAHHHIWESGRRPHSWLDAPELASIRRDFGPADLAPRARATRLVPTRVVDVLPVPPVTPVVDAPGGAETEIP
ncbi:hypothetical protein ACFV4G_35030, partial [Kitasatospora sp. NPDC059747]